MLRKTSIGLAAVAALALMVGGGTAAEARTHVSVGIGLGFPGYYGGSYYSPCPPYGYGYGYGACYAPPVIGFGFYGGHHGHWGHRHFRAHDWDHHRRYWRRHY